MRRIVLLALGVALAAARPAAAQTPSSATHREVSVPGLDKPVDIVVDHWGIAAHLRRQRPRRLLPAGLQRRARPALADRPVAQARPGPALRQLRARPMSPRTAPRGSSSIAATWPPSGRPTAPDARGGRGLRRRRQRLCGRGAAPASAPLPVEFKLTASQPELWSAEDVVRIRSHAPGLQRRLRGRPRPGGLRRRASPPTACAASWSRPTPPVVPAGLDPCVVPADVLKDYVLATEAVSFDAARPRRPRRPRPTPHLADLADERRGRGLQQLGDRARRAPPPAARSWPTIRTARWACRRCATSST